MINHPVIYDNLSNRGSLFAPLKGNVKETYKDFAILTDQF